MRWVGVTVGLVCGGLVWWDLHSVARFLWGGLASKLGLYAVLGQRRSSVMASLVRHDRVVAADLCMANRGSGGHSLCVARWRRWGLVRLEGQGMEVGIMWWRCGGLRTWHVG